MEIEIGSFVFDLAPVAAFFLQPVPALLFGLFILFGWTVVVYGLLYIGLHYLEEYKQEKYTHNWHWVLFAIDIPLLNVQTPKAVEQFFSHLAGAYDHGDIAAKYRHGHKQRWFSFEIISIEGYIQFLIRTEEMFRDLVEAAVYAQYPDVDIVEVEDYVASVPDAFPNETFDMWGADFGLAENTAIPIRTYKEFEHSISKDTVLKDSMGTFLESFSRIGVGEQMWFQILVEPISNSWKEKAIESIKKMLGEGGHGSEIPFLGAFGNIVQGLFDDINWQLTGAEYSAAAGHEDAKADKPTLAPGQSKIMEKMEEKIAKIGLKTKMRGIYVARKEVFRPERGVHALIGAINQFNVPSANSIVPTHGVSASYFFAKRKKAAKKTRMMKAYKKRKMKAGGNTFILNIEELATVWHFPMSHVKTPLVQKAGAKTVEPPSGLPMEMVPLFGDSQVAVSEPDLEEKKYGTDSAPEYGSEQKFG